MDARLLLIVAGAILAVIAGDPLAVLDAFQKALGQGGVIGPICTAMGYAWVLKATGCDRHMVVMLTSPLKSVTWLLIPGGALAGFVTNMAITSQTASAAAVGPILFPIMRAAGFSPVTSAATILVGCSVGGNLFNPGEPDIVAIQQATGVSVAAIMPHVLLPNVLAFGVAVLVLMILSRNDHQPVQEVQSEMQQAPRLLYAMMPPLPVLLLILLQPTFGLAPFLHDRYPNGVHVSAVMVACTALVMLVTSTNWRTVPAHAATLTGSFFEGMGYAFSKVISIIIAAACFISGLEAIGVLTILSAALAANASLAAVIAPIVTWLTAVVGGSGTAPSVAFSSSMLPGVAAVNPTEAVRLGVAGAVGANVGRTMSPVAAVVLYSCALADVPLSQLWKRVAPCMVAAVVVTIAVGLILRAL